MSIPNHSDFHHGLLVAIRERLKLVNGASVIVSAPGEGTRVEARVPLRGDG